MSETAEALRLETLARQIEQRAQEIHPDFRLIELDGDPYTIDRRSGRPIISVGLYVYAVIEIPEDADKIDETVAGHLSELAEVVEKGVDGIAELLGTQWAHREIPGPIGTVVLQAPHADPEIILHFPGGTELEMSEATLRAEWTRHGARR